MKNSKIILMIGLFIFGFSIYSVGQEVLPEVTLKAVRYKYLDAVTHKDMAEPVKMLERRAAEYDVRNSEMYEDDYDTYFVSFYIPEGRILAAYDKDGKLIRTAEKFKDITLPKSVRNSVTERFPNWNISKDFYLVDYFEENNQASKVYKLTLENGNKRMKVKVNEKGEFI
jgi:hypothetical protein